MCRILETMKTLDISHKVASKILNGGFKDFSVLDRVANENLSSDVTILYKKIDDKNKGDVFVIETFFINTL